MDSAPKAVYEPWSSLTDPQKQALIDSDGNRLCNELAGYREYRELQERVGMACHDWLEKHPLEARVVRSIQGGLHSADWHPFDSRFAPDRLSEALASGDERLIADARHLLTFTYVVKRAYSPLDSGEAKVGGEELPDERWQRAVAAVAETEQHLLTGLQKAGARSKKEWQHHSNAQMAAGTARGAVFSWERVAELRTKALRAGYTEADIAQVDDLFKRHKGDQDYCWYQDDEGQALLVTATNPLCEYYCEMLQAARLETEHSIYQGKANMTLMEAMAEKSMYEADPQVKRDHEGRSDFVARMKARQEATQRTGPG